MHPPLPALLAILLTLTACMVPGKDGTPGPTGLPDVARRLAAGLPSRWTDTKNKPSGRDHPCRAGDDRWEPR